MKYMGKITMLLRRPVVRDSFPSPNLSCSSSVLMLPVPFVHQKTRCLRDCPHSTAPYWLPSVPTGALVPVGSWGSPSCATFISNSCAWILSTSTPSIIYFLTGFLCVSSAVLELYRASCPQTHRIYLSLPECWE